MRPEGVVALADMGAFVLLIIVFGVLFVFWLWLGAIFNAISDHHLQAAARREPESREAMSATKGSVSSALPLSYPSSVSSQFQQHPHITSRS